MEGAEETREEINNSMRMNVLSRDLLHKFTNQTHIPKGNQQAKENLADEELQLSLGLSMNGRFGVDPDGKKLKRSSSISNLAFTFDNGSTERARGVNALLSRTCSLPAEPEDEWLKRSTESEEEWRRRKEIQSMKRMKRMEKLKNVRGGGKEKENCSEDNVNGSVTSEKVESGVINAIENVNVVVPSSQGSIGSQKSASSGFSVLQQSDGTKQTGEVKSPYGLPTLHVQGENESSVIQSAPNDPRGVDEMLKSALLDMPFVSTKVNGPNQKRVEGFLYRYKKGEEVKIVCVCHGLFLSPAEFLKHGGGGDVENPLKHIVVNATLL